VDKLDIGYAYPSYSTFLINGIGVNGINIESTYKKWYMALSYGTSKDSRLCSTNNQYFLQKFYDFFDSNNLKDGKSLTTIKVGIGEKEESHFYVGFLYGYGSQSPLYFNYSPGINQPPKEKNYVIELDGKIRLSKCSSVDILFGKSVVSDEEARINHENLISNLFNFNKRTNALLLKFNSYIKLTKTKITLSAKWIDPFFNSFGIGYMKSDVFSYDIKADQPISRKIKVSCFYRSNQNNLLNISLAKCSYKSIGLSLSYKINRHISLKGMFDPIFQKIEIPENNKNLKFKSYLSNAIVSINTTKGKVKSLLNFIFNFYNFYNGTRPNEYYSIDLSHSLHFKWFSNEIMGEMNKISTDTVYGNNIIIKDDLGFLINKSTLVFGIKWGYSNLSKDQFGYRFKFTIPLYKKMLLEMGGEKLLRGEYYFINTENIDYLFNCYGRMIYNF
jgi:hypothetical protein